MVVDVPSMRVIDNTTNITKIRGQEGTTLDLPGLFVLKVYDQRRIWEHCRDRRPAEKLPPWSPELEKNCQAFYLRQQSGISAKPSVMDQSHISATQYRKAVILHKQANKTATNMACAEMETYALAAGLQGDSIPRCYGLVRVMDYYSSKYTSPETLPPRYRTRKAYIGGILLQYIPTVFNLRELVKSAPKPRIPRDLLSKYACFDKAIAVVSKMMCLGICNQGFSFSNILFT
jgi:hypothetical protein